ncbi:MAG: murein biosynthesis integral membrane protein MurJ [Proteobacteria bacterium]|nr:murein biosynthesis integral membrane protein MurJ [Pseudomonadota bacterium]
MTDGISDSSQDRDSLARRTALASLGVLLSRFSGIFRSQVVNAVYGASTRLDAFNVALRFPSVLRDLFAEGALSAAFTTELVEAEREGVASLRRLVSVVCGFFLIVTLAISGLGYLFAGNLIGSVVSDGFRSRGGFELAVQCFRILIFYLPIAMISALAMSLLGTRGQTFRATIASAFFNVGTITGAVLGTSVGAITGTDPVIGLATGTLAGGLLQFLYQVYPLARDGLFPLPNFSPLAWYACQPLRNMLLMMGPRAVSQGALSLALFINTHFATAAGEGAITFITNAQVIILVPVGLFGVAAGFASLPILTKAVQEKDSEKLGALLSDSVQNTFWLSFFSLFAFVTAAVPFCVVLLEHGKVTAADSVQNAIAVCAYSIGMLFNSGSKVLIQGFYALNDVRRSMLNAFIYLSCNATLSALLAPRFGIVGLGLSNGISAAVDFSLNWIFLRRVSEKRGLFLDRLYSTGGAALRSQILLFSILAFVLASLGVRLAGSLWTPESALWTTLAMPRFATALVWLSVFGAVGVAAAAVLVKIAGPENLRRLLNRIGNKVLRRRS